MSDHKSPASGDTPPDPSLIRDKPHVIVGVMGPQRPRMPSFAMMAAAAALVADLGDGPLWEDLLEEVEPRPDKNDRGPLVPTHVDKNGDRRFGTAGPDRHYGLPFGGRPRE